MSHLLSSDDEREAELEDDPEEEEDENSNIAYVVQWTWHMSLNWVDLIYHINHDGTCCKIDLTSQWLDILCSFNVI